MDKWDKWAYNVDDEIIINCKYGIEDLLDTGQTAAEK
jgi:hypothetical protein